MKRLNRKKMIKEFEILRGGFAQACMRAAEANDAVLLTCMSAHHTTANIVIAELGGIGVDLPDYSQFINPVVRGATESRTSPPPCSALNGGGK